MLPVSVLLVLVLQLQLLGEAVGLGGEVGQVGLATVQLQLERRLLSLVSYCRRVLLVSQPLLLSLFRFEIFFICLDLVGRAITIMSEKTYKIVVQWNYYNPDTNGPEVRCPYFRLTIAIIVERKVVCIREVSSFQGCL